MKKVLICSFSCQPGKGSEPGVGWNWAIQAAKTQNVYVLTRLKMKSYIELSIPDEVKETLHFIYVPSSARLRKLSIYLEYLHWQYVAYSYVKKLLEETTFDYIWHLTWGNMFLPTFMYKLGVPFIWGPIGGDGAPKQFFKQFPIQKQVIHKIKYFLGKHAESIFWIKNAANNSSTIIARTEETKKMFSENNQIKTIVKLEACVDLDSTFRYKENTKQIIKNNDFINLGYTGRLIDFKNLSMLIRSFKTVADKNDSVVLHILGDGEDLKRIQSLVTELDLDNKVFFYGFVDREVMLKALESIDIFCFPSLREGASWSLLEAMAFEIPIIALNVNGISSTLTESGAIMVEVGELTPEQVEIHFTDAILKTIQMDKEDLKYIGKKERDTLVNNFSSMGIAQFIDELIR